MRTAVGTLVQVSALATLIGCGRIGFAPDGIRGDAGSGDGGGTSDAEVVTAIPIHDDFEGATLSSFWTFYNDATGTMGTVANGHYVVTLADQKAGSYAGLGLFDMPAFTAAAVWVQLAAAPPTGDGKICYLGAGGMQVGATGSGYLQITKPAPQSTVLIPFDYTAMRWWRIRGAAGTVRAETSPNGITWNEVTRIVQTPDLETTGVNLGGGTYFAVGGGETCVYESFNEPP